MRWLLTDAISSDRNELYQRWLGGAGVSYDIVGVGQDAPGDIRGYDALLLTGGGDVDPSLYDCQRAPETKSIRIERDRQEIGLIRQFMDAGVAVLGICRGIQILNVALGGGLIQHIPAALRLSGKEEHRAMGGHDSVHGIRFVGESALRDAWNGCDMVNSAHHQAVDPDRLAEGLKVIAMSDEGVIEAVEGRRLRSAVFAVQWHPERMDAAKFPVARLMELMIAISSKRR